MNDQKIKIMYSGMLNQWGGVSNFLQSILKLDEFNYEIIITGHSRDDRFDRIIAEHDKRVRFYGLVSNEKLRELMEEPISLLTQGQIMSMAMI